MLEDDELQCKNNKKYRRIRESEMHKRKWQFSGQFRKTILIKHIQEKTLKMFINSIQENISHSLNILKNNYQSKFERQVSKFSELGKLACFFAFV